jgi:hypothetical protein
MTTLTVLPRAARPVLLRVKTPAALVVVLTSGVPETPSAGLLHEPGPAVVKAVTGVVAT